MLDWTGERFVPWANEAAVAYEHLHRYLWACGFVQDKRVLDLASGEGYGADLLARRAVFVLGIDIDAEAIRHAAERYPRKNLQFLKGSLTAVPVAESHSFDVITCFEAIEHIEQHDDLMREVKRLLKPDGLFIVSTPNKEAYNPGSEANPFHVLELSFEEFNSLLTRYFRTVRYLGQRVHPGSSMWPIGGDNGMNFQEFTVERSRDEFKAVPTETRTPIYFVAMASDSVEAHPGGSVLTDCSNELVNEKDREVSRLQGELRQRDEAVAWLQRGKQVLETAAARNDQALTRTSRQVEELQQTNKELTAQLESATRKVAAMQQSLLWRALRKLGVWGSR